MYSTWRPSRCSHKIPCLSPAPFSHLNVRFTRTRSPWHHNPQSGRSRAQHAPIVRSGAPGPLSQAQDDARDTAAGEASSYVAELVEVDRTFELLSWVWESITRKKEPVAQGEEEGASASHTVKEEPAAPLVAASEVAVFGGGCFWCMEACLQMVRGVLLVESGFAAGTTADPTYAEVCAGDTGHAEVVRVTYDPAQVTYRQLLDMFLAAHDPTQLDRQGVDVGAQYRSIVLCQGADQLAAARQALEAAQGASSAPIVTEVRETGQFYLADSAHQQYYMKNPTGGYCREVLGPKVRAFKSQFREHLYQFI